MPTKRTMRERIKDLEELVTSLQWQVGELRQRVSQLEATPKPTMGYYTHTEPTDEYRLPPEGTAYPWKLIR